MKIKFTLLSLKNFMSYGAEPTIIPLDRPGTTLILGEDLDNISGSKSNGVGKSTLINGLAYGVYDKPVSNISKDNLVNNINKKHMEVIVEFEKGGNLYRIKRVRKAKSYAAGNYVELYENGHDITPDSVANTNKLIEQIIGIPYELFVRIVVVSAASHTPFLDLPVRHPTLPNQTDIIEELFDLKTLSEKSALLKEQQKELETQLDRHLDRVKILEQERERHKKQLQSAKQRVIAWDENTQQEIAKLKKKLERIRTVDIETQHTLHTKLVEASDSVSEAQRHFREIEKEILKVTKELKRAETELAHLVDEKCPYCLQQYSESKTKIEDTEKVVAATTATLEQLQQQRTNIEELVLRLDEERQEIRNQITVSDLEELLEIQSKSSEYERRISELEKAVNPYLEPLEELESIVFDEINYDEINELDKRLEHMKFLYKLLTKKDSFVRKVLLNKNLPFLNQRLQEYLTNLGLSHQVEFTHEMTAHISQFGRELDFGNLSNGQRARVNLALSFAFRDVLQSLHNHINVCMLDEVLDVGLDGPGITAAARMLKRKARDENLSLYIISHRDEIDRAFDRTLTVQMNEGFSQIVFDEQE